jgi:hypothetical protein
MSTTFAVAPKRITKAETARRLSASMLVVNRLIASGELKTVPLANTRAIILESSVDQLVARMTGDDRQVG